MGSHGTSWTSVGDAGQLSNDISYSSLIAHSEIQMFLGLSSNLQSTVHTDVHVWQQRTNGITQLHQVQENHKVLGMKLVHSWRYCNCHTHTQNLVPVQHFVMSQSKHDCIKSTVGRHLSELQLSEYVG